MSGESIGRLEVTLGRLLQGGVLSAAACLAAGLAMWSSGSLRGVATVLLTAGLMILMATPILRVVVSLVEYARMRDWFFVSTTLFVFGVLVVTVTLALLQQ
jgi:predicted metal-binding membrane protein